MATAKKARTLTPKQLDKLIGTLWATHATGVQIDIIDITNVFRDVRAAFVAVGCPKADTAEAALVPAIQEAIVKYRRG